MVLIVMAMVSKWQSDITVFKFKFRLTEKNERRFNENK